MRIEIRNPKPQIRNPEMFAFNRKERIALVALGLALLVGGAISWVDRLRPEVAAEFQVLPGAVEVPEEESVTVLPQDAPVVSRGTLDLNAATVSDLERLPGIGPKMAERIVRYRERMGPFRSVDDLTKVRGIGARTLEKLRPMVTVEP